jgi:hypothetical protein
MMERRDFLLKVGLATAGFIIQPYSVLESSGLNMVVRMNSMYQNFLRFKSNTQSRFVSDNINYLNRYSAYSGYNNYFRNLSQYYQNAATYINQCIQYNVNLYNQNRYNPYVQNYIAQSIQHLEQQRQSFTQLAQQYHNTWLQSGFGLYYQGYNTYGFTLYSHSGSQFFPTYAYDYKLPERINVSIPMFSINAYQGRGSMKYLSSLGGPHLLGLTILSDRLLQNGNSKRETGDRLIPTDVDENSESNRQREGDPSFSRYSRAEVQSKTAKTELAYEPVNSRKGKIKIVSEKWSGFDEPVEGEIIVEHA